MFWTALTSAEGPIFLVPYADTRMTVRKFVCLSTNLCHRCPQIRVMYQILVHNANFRTDCPNICA
jgi:hypothetical protein